MNKTEQSKNQVAPKVSQQPDPNGQATSSEKPIENKADQAPREVNGPKGLEPTRYGDWEANGRCYDF